MADYRSYRQIRSDQITSGSISSTKLASGVAPRYCVKHFYGHPCYCTPGCCCYWQVPTGVEKLTFELWGAGGNGNGACSCNRCQHYQGASGGTYNTKTISTNGGCYYTVCAGGVYRCLSRECYGCTGCSSYVNGSNLSNFCAFGGRCGQANTGWWCGCSSTNPCCLQPGNNGGDFGIGNHDPGWSVSKYDTYRGWCHCWQHATSPTSAPLIGSSAYQSLRSCWIRCGCWTVPYGHGGMSALTTYCGSGHCGQGGTGGGGLVKITYF